jgi:hypothetical protein
VFTVSPPAPSTVPLQVHAGTQNGTAKAGEDYEAISVDLKFKRGETQRTVRVRIVGDRLTEPQEAFSLILGQPLDAVMRPTTITPVPAPSVATDTCIRMLGGISRGPR